MEEAVERDGSFNTREGAPEGHYLAEEAFDFSAASRVPCCACPGSLRFSFIGATDLKPAAVMKSKFLLWSRAQEWKAEL